MVENLENDLSLNKTKSVVRDQTTLQLSNQSSQPILVAVDNSTVDLESVSDSSSSSSAENRQILSKSDPATQDSAKLVVEAADSRTTAGNAGTVSNKQIEQNYESAITAGSREVPNHLTTESAHHKLVTLNGLLRHRLVVSAVACFSLGILGVSTFDLSALISTTATIDQSFHLQPSIKKPMLPTELSFAENIKERDGMFAVKKISWDKTTYGFVNAAGVVTVKPQFEQVRSFNDGLAAVKEKGGRAGWGFVDKNGAFVLKPQFLYVNDFSDGVALVRRGRNLMRGLNDSRYGSNFNSRQTETTELIDLHGNVLFADSFINSAFPQNNFDSLNNYPSSNMMGGCYVITDKKGLKGLLSKSGKIILPPVYSDISRLNARYYTYTQHDASVLGWVRDNRTVYGEDKEDRFFRIQKNGLNGVVDSSGKIIIPLNYEGISSFNDGHAVFLSENKYGVVDTSGKVIIEPIYDQMTEFNDLIAVRKGRKWSFIDDSGHPVVGVRVDEIVLTRDVPWLSNGLGAVRIGRQVGFVNSKGQLAIKPQFAWALAFREGYAPVWTGTLWRFIDASGQLKGSEWIGATSHFYNGLASVVVPGPFYLLAKAKVIEEANNSIRSWTKNSNNYSPGVDSNSAFITGEL